MGKKKGKIIENSNQLKNKLLQYFTSAECNLTSIDENGNKIPNLIITACKRNKIEALKFLLKEDVIKIIEDTNGNFYDVEDVDDSNHNMFYYSILTSNTDLIEFLINNWPYDYLQSHPDDLNRLLSASYEELELQNVVISHTMKLYVYNQLVDLNFFCVSPFSEVFNVKNIKARVCLLLDNIISILDFANVCETSLYLITTIAKHVYVLKRILKCTYDKLPWEEIEFCCVAFVISFKKREGFNFFCRSVLSFSRLQSHLKNFYNQLRLLNVSYLKSKTMSVLPNSSREQVIHHILKLDPSFETLYKDYNLIRDIYSLSKIRESVSLSVSVDPFEREGQLAILRSLQVTGEFLKNSLEAPKLSKVTVDLILMTLPIATRNLMMTLRNALSHSYSYSIRKEIEKNLKIYSGIQDDLKQILEITSDVLYNLKISITVDILKEIVEISNPSLLKEISQKFCGITNDLTEIKLHPFEKVCQTVAKLNNLLPGKTFFEEKMFDGINQIIKNGFIDKKFNFFEVVILVELCLSITDSTIGCDHNKLRGIQYQAKALLNKINMKNLIEHDLEHDNFKNCIVKLFRSVAPRANCEIMKEFYTIFNIINIDIYQYSAIEGISLKLSNIILSKAKFQEDQGLNISNVSLARQELESILMSSGIIKGDSFDITELVVTNKKVIAAIEVLLLDMMSLLMSENKIRHNILSFDSNYFVLTGKCLRNHLAHLNHIMGVLYEESDLTLFEIINAIKFVKQSDTHITKQTNKLWNPSFTFIPKLIFDNHLSNLNKKKEFFSIIESGKLEIFLQAVKEGGEILSRDAHLCSTLHYAAKAPNSSVLNYLLKATNSHVLKSNIHQSILHMAAEYGRNKNIALLIKIGLDVNDLDCKGRSPLHLAVMNNHLSTIKVLIQHGANLSLHDNYGKAPLHYAVEYGYLDIIDLLLWSKDVDKNLVLGNFSCLIVAAENGNLELVNYMISQGADVNWKADKGGSALLSAAINGHYKVAEFLIAHGANVNDTTFDGLTPLHNASETGRIDIVKLLLKSGAQVNATDIEAGITPLYFAACYGFNEVVINLLNYGADTNICDNLRKTPFHIAIENNHKDVVETLISYCHNINTKISGGYTALHLAVKCCSSDIVEDLISNGAFVDSRSATDNTPLHLASQLGSSSVIKCLIEHGACVNASNISGLTPLHLASEGNHKESVALLLKSGAQSKMLNLAGFSALHLAAASDSKEAAEVLLHFSSVNHTGLNDFSPLHIACYQGHSNIANLLLKHGALVNSRVPELGTPLSLAVSGGHKDIVIALIDNGASLQSVEENQQMILSTINNNRMDILLILASKGINIQADIRMIFLSAIFSGFKGIVNMLLSNKLNYLVDVNFKEEISSNNPYFSCWKTKIDSIKTVRGTPRLSPLLLASALGEKDVVEMLISFGANLETTDNDGNSSLHLAAARGHSDIVEILLKASANNDIKNMSKKTPFELAVENGQECTVDVILTYKVVSVDSMLQRNSFPLHIAAEIGNINIVINLVKHGFDLHLKNKENLKPIHLAVQNGHVKIVEYLISCGNDIEECGSSEETLLHHAVKSCYLNMVQFLIKNHLSINVVDNCGNSPLHYAASFDNVNIVQYLLKSGCYFNTKNIFGKKPSQMASFPDIKVALKNTEELFAAVKKSDCSQIDFFIKQGAIINAIHSELGSPLHYASWKGFEEVTTILLRNNSCSNIWDRKGFHPLHYAAKFAHHSIVLILLESGAAFNILSKTGKTPSDLCKDQKILEIMNILKNSFEKVKSKNISLIKDLKFIKEKKPELLKVAIKAKNSDSHTLLILAVKCGFPKIDELKKIIEGDYSFQENTADLLCAQERYDEALDIIYSVLKMKKEVLNENDPGIMNSELLVARILYKKQMYNKSLELSKLIYEKQKLLYGEDHANTLKTESSIALILHRMGNQIESLSLFEKVCEKQKKVLGSNDKSYIETLSHMALVLDATGRHQEALEVNNKVLNYRIKHNGKNSPLTLVGYNNIALTLNHLGKYDEAINIFQKVYEGRVKLLGVSHSDTMRVLQNIAGVLFAKKNNSEALKMFNNILEAQRKALGSRHIDVLQTELNIANILFRQGNVLGALKFYKECFVQGIATLGNKHPMVTMAESQITVIKEVINLTGMQVEDIFETLHHDFITAVSEGNSVHAINLLERGIFVNKTDCDGRSALHFAVASSNADIVTMLIERGADVTLATNKGNTSLHLSVSKNNLFMTELLLSSVSEKCIYGYINTQTKDGGNTALHVAAKNGSVEIICCLLKRGAIYNIVNTKGKTAVDVSTSNEISTILKSIDECFFMVKSKDKNVFNTISSMSPNIRNLVLSARNKEGKTIVLSAIQNKQSQLANSLMKI